MFDSQKQPPSSRLPHVLVDQGHGDQPAAERRQSLEGGQAAARDPLSQRRAAMPVLPATRKAMQDQHAFSGMHCDRMSHPPILADTYTCVPQSGSRMRSDLISGRAQQATDSTLPATLPKASSRIRSDLIGTSKQPVHRGSPQETLPDAYDPVPISTQPVAAMPSRRLQHQSRQQACRSHSEAPAGELAVAMEPRRRPMSRGILREATPEADGDGDPAPLASGRGSRTHPPQPAFGSMHSDRMAHPEAHLDSLRGAEVPSQPAACTHAQQPLPKLDARWGTPAQQLPSTAMHTQQSAAGNASDDGEDSSSGSRNVGMSRGPIATSSAANGSSRAATPADPSPAGTAGRGKLQPIRRSSDRLQQQGMGMLAAGAGTVQPPVPAVRRAEPTQLASPPAAGGSVGQQRSSVFSRLQNGSRSSDQALSAPVSVMDRLSGRKRQTLAACGAEASLNVPAAKRSIFSRLG